MTDQGDGWKTNDMTLVAYMRLNGKEPTRVEWHNSDGIGGSSFWFFIFDEKLENLMDDFYGGEARVEPREYNRAFAVVKTEMHGAKRAQPSR